ncbi:MAG: radical SAM protein [Desulfurococcaceae archaeon]
MEVSYKEKKRLPTIQEIIRGLNLKMEKMPLPTFIQIEPTTKCNFNCIMCTRKTLNQKRLNKDLTLEEFKEIFRQIPTVRKIKLQGLGEPLMNPYLHEIVAYGRERGISFTTTVNGSLLSGRNLEMILQFFDEVVISLDTTDRERYSMIRGHKMYDDIIKNIKECVKRKRETMRRINIGINSVISHLNYDEIPKLVELSKSLGVDYISIVEVENWKIPTEKGYVYEASFINKAREVKQKIHEYVEMCRKEGFTIYFSSSEKKKVEMQMAF